MSGSRTTNLAGAAAHLHVSERQLAYLAANGLLPYRLDGTEFRFDLDQLDARFRPGVPA